MRSQFIMALCCLLECSFAAAGAETRSANRFAHQYATDTFYPGPEFPRLTTPQWVGEDGIKAVVILSIDDLGEFQKYETFLRPVLDRLRQIDGRAPVSIMTVKVDPAHPHLQSWLREGVSLECHTTTHRHPILSEGNFVEGARTYHESVDLMRAIPGNRPVAFRLPYCDSMNAASPRFYAEIFATTNKAGRFLTIDSSIAVKFTTNDATIPRELRFDAAGRERFAKYLPAQTNAITRVSLGEFATCVEDYPYPYVIGHVGWEFPMLLPSDWEAHNLHGSTNAATLADWKAALDITVAKEGVLTLVFHPHGWISSRQLVEFIDYAQSQYGQKVKFLNFRDAQELLDKHLLAGETLRAAHGGENGVRVLDINGDGFMDVAVGNSRVKRTRIWQPSRYTWRETSFPTETYGAHFGILGQLPFVLSSNGKERGAWAYEGEKWVERPDLLQGFELDGKPVLTAKARRDNGVRVRDTDSDGSCEIVVGNPDQNVIFGWNPTDRHWNRLAYALPNPMRVVDERGRDAGLRWVDLNEDGYDDVLFSDARQYGLYLFVPSPNIDLGWKKGWTDMIVAESRVPAPTNAGLAMPKPIPPLVREGEHVNNGGWFYNRRLWIQNEDTAQLPHQVESRSYRELLTADQPPPRSAQESLQSIRVHPGFKVELVAQEPLTMDPVWFDWGPDGRFWVVEMGDYPMGIDGRGKPGGVVRFLQDTNHDGRYDHSTVFLEGVNFPNGILPWGKGVIVSAAPDIFYAEDTNGDGRADVRKVLFTGFTEGNQQHRVNGFDYGLDNWVYAANGDSGGVVRSLLTGKTVDIRGRDVRFRPADGAFETTAGQTQYGRHRDDWGNWFGNNNITWLWHYHLPEHYLVRNPHLAVRSMKQTLAQYSDSDRLYPTSRFLQRFNWPEAVNLVTSASAAMPYRDELFGPEFADSVFICEPVYQAIHREVLKADGITFTSHRAATETNFEFFASTDNWCRPVFVKVGPDGALYVADMYRFVIEHPEWIPPAMQKRLDLRAGSELGRIYRVFPEKAPRRSVPRLDHLDTPGLVRALDHPSGWQRDMAQMLLVQRRDTAAVPRLEQLVRTSSNSKARIHALWTLSGLDAITAETAAAALQDSHAQVREHALQVTEPLLKKPVPAALAEAVLRLAEDPEIRVRYQLAYTLGEWTDTRAGQALARLATKDFGQAHMDTAILSSAVPHVGTMLENLFTDSTAAPRESFVEQLIGLAIALKRDNVLLKPFSRMVQAQGEDFAPWQFTALGGVLDALDRRKLSVAEFRASCAPDVARAVERFDLLFARARTLAKAKAAAVPTLIPAVRLLGRGGDQAEALELLRNLMSPQSPPELQRAALATLRRIGGAKVSELLMGGWRGFTPELRREALNVLFTRPEWMQALLTAVEQGTIPAVQVDPAHQQTLLTHAQPAIRERSAKLFATPNPDRQAVLQSFQAIVELKGDPIRGKEFFAPNCGTCHQLKGEGTSIGADLGTVADKPVEYLLTAILDPNRAVEDRFISYTVVTRDDREFSGIITVETPNSITLRNATGQEVVLRNEIQELTSSALSLMPEGLEAAFKPQDLADLIAYIKSVSGGAKP